MSGVWLLVAAVVAGAGCVRVPGCCAPGHALDTASLTCVAGRVARDSLDTWLGAGAELEPEQRPSCPNLEVLPLAGGGARLGAGAGQLVTSKYGPVSVGQYCLAATTLGQAVALTCDPCQDGEVACIDLCCPHGEVRVYKTLC